MAETRSLYYKRVELPQKLRRWMPQPNMPLEFQLDQLTLIRPWELGKKKATARLSKATFLDVSIVVCAGTS